MLIMQGFGNWFVMDGLTAIAGPYPTSDMAEEALSFIRGALGLPL